MGMRLRNFKAPAAQVEDIVDKTKDITKADDAYAGDLTEEGAKSLLSMGGRRGGAGAAGFQRQRLSQVLDQRRRAHQVPVLKVSGTITRNGDDVDIDRTTTVEIKDVGTTKLAVPDEAKSKMS